MTPPTLLSVHVHMLAVDDGSSIRHRASDRMGDADMRVSALVGGCGIAIVQSRGLVGAR